MTTAFVPWDYSEAGSRTLIRIKYCDSGNGDGVWSQIVMISLSCHFPPDTVSHGHSVQPLFSFGILLSLGSGILQPRPCTCCTDSSVVETCTLLMRMSRDFGDHTLPTEGGKYLRVANDPVDLAFAWNDVLQVTEFMFKLAVENWHSPAWTPGSGLRIEGARFVIMAFVPSSSPICRRWGTGTRVEGVGDSKGDIVPAVNGSVASVE